MSKVCRGCQKTLPDSAFRKNAGGRRGLRSKCRECDNVYKREYSRRPATREREKLRGRKTRHERPEVAHASYRRYYLKWRALNMCRQATKRARSLGVPYTLTPADIADLQHRINNGRCELTGHPLSLTVGPLQFNSPSLDRIIPALGYTPGNIRVVCFAINAALGNWGEAVVLELIESWWKKRHVKLEHDQGVFA